MPIIGVKLGTLIKNKMIKNISELSGVDPSQQQNPQYFNSFCYGLGNGIALGTKNIVFKTSDKGVTNPLGGVGAGKGIGIKFDSEYMIKTSYSKIRDEVIKKFGATTHDPYPPNIKNSGEYLLAILKSIAESIKEVYETDLILTSTHFPVMNGVGLIEKGNFSGLIEENIKSLIISSIPAFNGSFWPNFVKIVSESYVDTVHNHSTSKVIITGAGSVPSTGSGNGKVT